MPVAEFLVNHAVKQSAVGSEQWAVGSEQWAVDIEQSASAAEAQKSLPTDQLPTADRELPFDPFSFSRRASREVLNFGQSQVPRVIADIRHRSEKASDLNEIGYSYVPAWTSTTSPTWRLTLPISVPRYRPSICPEA
jgi:hypothetical protein